MLETRRLPPLRAFGAEVGACRVRIQSPHVGLVRLALPVAETVARDHDLADDLAGREVAHQPLRAGVAERAGERATDLAGDAQRAAVGLGDVDAFDLVRALVQTFARALAGQPQKPFARAVDRDLLGNDFRAREREVPIEAGAQLFRHAGHGIEMGGAAHVEPVPELLHPHLALRRRHAETAQRLRQLGTRQAHQRGLVRRHVALERRLFDEARGRCARSLGDMERIRHR